MPLESPVSTQTPRTSREGELLLKEAVLDHAGRIYRIQDVSGGVRIQTHGKSFTNSDNPREVALWEDVLAELEVSGLIRQNGSGRQVFSVTKRGFDLGELLNRSESKQ